MTAQPILSFKAQENLATFAATAAVGLMLKFGGKSVVTSLNSANALSMTTAAVTAAAAGTFFQSICDRHGQRRYVEGGCSLLALAGVITVAYTGKIPPRELAALSTLAFICFSAVLPTLQPRVTAESLIGEVHSASYLAQRAQLTHHHKRNIIGALKKFGHHVAKSGSEFGKQIEKTAGDVEKSANRLTSNAKESLNELFRKYGLSEL